MKIILATGILPEIEALDLSRIKWKLIDSEDSQGWSVELCEFAEREYRKYLTLAKIYPNKDIVPNKVMDKFWHQHILDTQAYAKDCQAVFGHFFHHYPYFGIYDTEDK